MNPSNPQSPSSSPDSSEIDELVHLLGCQNLTEATNADRKGELLSYIEAIEPEIRQKLEALQLQAKLEARVNELSYIDPNADITVATGGQVFESKVGDRIGELEAELQALRTSAEDTYRKGE